MLAMSYSLQRKSNAAAFSCVQNIGQSRVLDFGLQDSPNLLLQLGHSKRGRTDIVIMLSGGLRRKAAPSILGCARQLSTSSSVQAAPAVIEKPSGFLSMIFGKPREAMPMTEELTDYQIPSPVGPGSTPPETQSTTLTNGIKIVSEATYVSFRSSNAMPNMLPQHCFS